VVSSTFPNICPGQTDTLFADLLVQALMYSNNPKSPAHYISQYPTFSWSNGATTSATIINQPGTYIVTINDSSCIFTDTVIIGLNTGSINVSISASPGATICNKQPVTLTASGAQNYTWSPSLGLDTTAGNTVVVSYPNGGLFPSTYTVTGSGKGECPDTATIHVHINPATPFAHAQFDSICSGQLDLLTTGLILPHGEPGPSLMPHSNYPTFSWSNGITTNTTTITQPGTYIVTINDSSCIFTDTVIVTLAKNCGGDIVTEQDCYCVSSFAPIPGKKYLVSAWVKEKGAVPTKTSYTYPVVYLDFYGSSITSLIATFGAYIPAGNIIDGWQRIENTFIVPDSAQFMRLRLQNQNPTTDVLFDDIRVFPFDGSMKSYVYDPTTLRLVAELDERNYATKYEYDEEGKLIRVKKETAKGIQTIKESRKATPKK